MDNTPLENGLEAWRRLVHRVDPASAQAIMMDTCPVELERHLMLNSDRFDMYPKVRPAIRDYIEQVRHQRDPMEVGETALSENRDERAE